MRDTIVHRIAVALICDRAKLAHNIDPNFEEMMDARAALEALKDPTDTMIAAATDALRDPRINTRKLAVVTVWKVMIDTALMEAKR